MAKKTVDETTTPAEVRRHVRNGYWKGPTAGLCPDYVQLNMAIMGEEYADDFQRFCEENPKPCPVLEVIRDGKYEAVNLAPGSDIRKDFPAYLILQRDTIIESHDIFEYWRSDFVSFLIGCSFTFEQALIKNNIPVRHIECESNVPMYITNIPCRQVGPFHGNMVVSMRPIPAELVDQAYSITSRYPAVHGAPVHHGNSQTIGIANLDKPDFGTPVPIYKNEVPVFWACGVTPQVALKNANLPLSITHAPGHMLISDIKNSYFRNE